jgi:hypothetical protein
MKDAGNGLPLVLTKKTSQYTASVLQNYRTEKWYALNPLRANVNLVYLWPSSYSSDNTLCVSYKNQSFNVV